MPTLIVKRDKGWADKLRSYRIVLDGAVIGTVGEGEILRQPISEGPHEIEAKIDWCRGRPLRFTATSEDSVVEVRSSVRGWHLFLGVFYVFFRRRDYLKVHVVNQPAT